MSERNWRRADQYSLDPARAVRDPKEQRSGGRTLNEWIALASILAPTIKTIQQRLDAGVKIYPFERHRLEDWNRMVAEIMRLQEASAS